MLIGKNLNKEQNKAQVHIGWSYKLEVTHWKDRDFIQSVIAQPKWELFNYMKKPADTKLTNKKYSKPPSQVEFISV